MTDCPNAEIRDLLPDLVHGTLAGGDRQRVELHIAACADCAAEVALIRRARTVLSRGVPAVDAQRIAATIPAFSQVPARGRSFGAWRIAASIVVVAIGAMTFELVRREQNPLAGTLVGETAVANIAEARMLSFAGRLSSLADEELEQLLADIDALDAGVPEEPARVLPVPVWDGGSR